MADSRPEKVRPQRPFRTLPEMQDERRLAWFRPELLVACLAVLCYINTPSNGFCDDGNAVVHRGRKVNEPGQWAAIWTTDYWSEDKEATPNRDLLYRPVSLSSYRLVRAVAGDRASVQLLVNMILHALVCVLLVRVFGHLTGSRTAALVAGFVAAALPIHTEVINNVVGRADLLSSVGILAAVLWHRRSMVALTGGSVVGWRLIAAAAAFVAMGAKESGVSVVSLVVLFDGYWYRPWRPASHNRRWWAPRSLLRLTYLLVPLGIYLVLRWFALEGHLYQRPALTKTVNVLVDAPGWQHALGVVQLWGMYWRTTIWPQILCVNYSINAIRLATSFLDFYVLLGSLTAIGLVIASVLAWRRGVRCVAYVSAAIVLSYAPTANALVLIQVFFAERIWYLPSVWIAILAGLSVATLVKRPIWCFVFALVLLGMAQRCWRRNAEWHDNRTLYAAAYRDHPNAVGVLCLYGRTLVEEGDIQDGIGLLRRAIEIDQGFTDAQRLLGQAYLRAGAFHEALHHLQIANMQVPGHPGTEEALEYVSQTLSAQEEPKLRHLREQVDDRPDDIEANLRLVRMLRELGRVDEALQRLQAGSVRFEKDLTWQAELAVTLVYLNRRDRAIAQYWKCVELDPSDPHIAVELAMLLLERRGPRDLDQAGQLAERAARLAAGAPYVLACRAELLALRGDLAGAVRLYGKAIEALPPGSEERRIYHQRAKALGQ